MKTKNKFFLLMKVFFFIYYFCNKLKTFLKTFFGQYNYNHLPLFIYVKTKKTIRNISNFWIFYFLFLLKKIKEKFKFVYFKKMKKYIRIRKFTIKFFIKFVLSFPFIKTHKYIDKDIDDSVDVFYDNY